MGREMLVGIALAVAACGRQPEPEDTGQTSRQGQAVETSIVTTVETQREMIPPSAIGYHADPIPGSAFPPQVPPDLPESSAENTASATWPAQLAAKQVVKEQQRAKDALNRAPIPTASPGMAEKQEQFLQIVHERQAELDALDPAAREVLYYQIKDTVIGE